MTTPIPIALIDDHTLVRKGVAELINGLGDYKVVQQAANGREYVDALGTSPSSRIAVVDLNMPVMDGYETIAWIAANRPDTLPIALTFEANDQNVLKALRSGARGFLLKDIEPEELRRALDSLCLTGYYHSELTLTSMVSQKVEVSEAQRDRAAVLAQISEREADFLRHVCSPEELTYEEISRRMFLHMGTIDGYRKNLFTRFGLRSRTGLVLFAIKWGIAKP